jgi:cellulose synthase/poly-beta-1,6-N-acetylglucosamine synthase-like glycosyltransferase
MKQLAYVNRKRRRRLALLLPGHNEEMILAETIRSAVAAGIAKRDIYMVDDDSSDATRAIALRYLPAENVLTVARSGKAGAVYQAISHFSIVKRYVWLHVADADSIFCSDYFRIYKRHLNGRKLVAAVGFVQSLPGNWLATYRSFSYTYGQHIFRRIQSWVGAIAVLPGPVTCFKTDIIKDLDFKTESLTEDFDLTLQIHRKRLGRIRFIPEAVNFTQDPRTLRDFISQTLRWQRGFFQGIRKYRVGLRPHVIDFGVGYQMGETVYYFVQMLIVLPFILISTHNIRAPIAILGADFIAIAVLALFSSYASKRPRILIALLYFYVLRFLELGIFVWAFFEVIVFRRFQTVGQGWQTEGRRYKVAAEDIKELQ